MIYVLKHMGNEKFGVVRWNVPSYNKLTIREAQDQEQIYCTTDKAAAINTLGHLQSADCSMSWYVAEFQEHTKG